MSNSTNRIPAPAATERWSSLSVLGFSRYEVSDRGRLRSLITRDAAGQPYVLRLSRGKNGYLAASLQADDGRERLVKAHIAVAAAFLGPRPEGHVVSHRDDVKANNVVENLAYVTYGANLKAAYENGARTVGRRPKMWGRGRVSTAQARAIRAALESGCSAARVAEEYAISESYAKAIAAGRRLTWVGDDTLEAAELRLAAEAAERQQRDARLVVAGQQNLRALRRVALPADHRPRRAA